MGFPHGILVVCCVLLGRSLTGFPDGTGIASCDCLMYIGDDLRIVIPEEKKNSSSSSAMQPPSLAEREHTENPKDCYNDSEKIK